MKRVALILVFVPLFVASASFAGVSFFEDPNCQGMLFSLDGGQIADLDDSGRLTDDRYGDRIRSVLIGGAGASATERRGGGFSFFRIYASGSGQKTGSTSQGTPSPAKGIEIFQEPDFGGDSEYIEGSDGCHNLEGLAGEGSSLKVYR